MVGGMGIGGMGVGGKAAMGGISGNNMAAIKDGRKQSRMVQ